MHCGWVDEYADYYWENLEEFKGLYTCCGVDFFQKKVYWKEEKVREETEDREQEEGKEGGSEEESHRERKLFPLQHWRPLEVELLGLPSKSEE